MSEFVSIHLFFFNQSARAGDTQARDSDHAVAFRRVRVRKNCAFVQLLGVFRVLVLTAFFSFPIPLGPLLAILCIHSF